MINIIRFNVLIKTENWKNIKIVQKNIQKNRMTDFK